MHCKSSSGTVARAIGTLGVLLALTAGSLLAAPRERAFRLLAFYSTSEHGVGAQNFTISEDPRGVIYAGNIAGVVEYDGVWWRSITMRNEAPATALLPLADGRIAVGGIDEMGYLQPDGTGGRRYVSLVTTLPKESQNIGETTGLHLTSDGVVFVTTTMIVVWNDRGARVAATFPEDDSPRGTALVDGVVWFWTPSGMHQFKDGKVSFAPGGEQFAKRRTRVLARWPSGDLLLAIRDEGLFLFRDGKATPFAPEVSQRVNRDLVADGHFLPDGRFAMVTRRGGVILMQSDGSIDEIIDASVGLPDSDISESIVASDGSLWLAMDNGVTRVEASSPVSVIDARGGLRGTVVSATRHHGVLYAGTTSGLYTIGAVTKGEGNEGPIARRVGEKIFSGWSLLADGDELLVGSSDGIYDIAGNQPPVKLAGSEDVTPYCMVRSSIDPNLVYAGIDDGLAILRKEGGRWVFRGKVEGMLPHVRTLIEEGDGELWMGTTFNGAVRARVNFDGGVAKASGVAQCGDGEVGAYRLAGRIVFTGGKNRLLRCDEKSMKLVPDPVLGSFGNQSIPFAVAEDAQGNIWLNTQPPSVARHRPNGTWAFDDRVLVEMPGKDVQFIFTEPDGVVWFGSEEGFVRYDSRVQRQAAEPRKPLIRRVLAGGVPLQPKGGAVAEVKPDVSRIRIETAAVSFDPGVLYQYRLSPSEGAWSAWTTEPFTEFTNLWEGDYTFYVRAKVLNKVSPVERFTFRVLPPWYRTPVAWVVWATLFLLALVVIPLVRNLTLRERAKVLEQRVAEQTKELTTAVEQLRVAKAELEEKNDQLKEANVMLEELSFYDPLTGIPNRRQFEESLKTEWNRAWRTNTSLGFVLMDIDLFKALNDTRGHQEGDECLKEIGRFLQRSLRRSGDVAARYGGEEFAMILPNTDLEGARHFAEQLRVGIEQLKIENSGSPYGSITASFGVASVRPTEAESPDDLLMAADRALYRAKADGRNVVRTADNVRQPR